MRAILYTRISADVAGDGHGVAQQHAECLALAERLDWTVVETFSDNDISAYSGKRRPGYEAMLEYLIAGKADAVVAWHTDRLHRSLSDLERFVEICTTHKVRIETVRSGTIDLSTSAGQMVAGMLAVAARHEVGHMIERQTASHSRRAAEGTFRGGRRRFGFESDGMTHQVEEADAIRDAVSRLLGGASIGSVTRDWNGRGLTGTSGKPWITTTVRRTLHRPALAGLAEYRGEIVGTGKWEPIVDAEDWRAMVAVLAESSKFRGVSYERRWQGSGVYTCGKCGAPMTIGRSPGYKGRPAISVYKCSKQAHLSRNAEMLDGVVSALVVGRLSRPDARLIVDRPSDGVDVPALQALRDGYRSRLQAVGVAFAEGDMDRGQMRAANELIHEKMGAVDRELASARTSSPLSELVLSGENVAERWPELGPDLRGKVVAELMSVVVEPIPLGSRNKPFSSEFISIEWLV
ncbi:recombinase family protein [Rhodococcus sp. H36-A4]|uniref:recombinase family protein n=1 Tax=Rhodococcus sp. H36-A4 TaxID=3004353 RepID=UPI0022AF3BDE|nr:recombinase family protein [Rhodococcus sp. H36-A4]MCZ4077813.1 recombinase family protein [Rhodococcus sp. H36-A4]